MYVVKKFLFFTPEIIIFILSLLLIIYGFLNIKISPAPKDFSNLQSNIDHTYCIPVPRLDVTSEEKKVISSINNAYRLMIISIISGFLLLLISFYMFTMKILKPQENQNY